MKGSTGTPAMSVSAPPRCEVTAWRRRDGELQPLSGNVVRGCPDGDADADGNTLGNYFEYLTRQTPANMTSPFDPATNGTTADTAVDTDGDGTMDCIDDCPDDPAKTEPGACGCGVADTDGEDRKSVV